MLFDLRGRGRQRTVRVVYFFLALLMGGSLLLIGNGSLFGNGGPSTSGGGGSATDALNKQVKAAEKRIQANRSDAQAWDDLTRARFSIAADSSNAQDDGTLKDSGLAELRQADRAWTEHVRLAKDKADANTAVLMIKAYGALGEKDKAVNAAELFATSKNNVGAYVQYAEIAYAADQSRTGDLAGKRAVALATPAQRSAIKSQVEQAKSDAQSAAIQQATQGATGASGPNPLSAGLG